MEVFPLPKTFLTVGEWVRPGNIILRQKGTQWHPGENVPLQTKYMGIDF